MKRHLRLTAALAAVAFSAATQAGTIAEDTFGCLTVDQYGTFTAALYANDLRLADSIIDSGACFGVARGSDFSALDARSIWDGYQKVRVWGREGEYFDAYVPVNP